MLIVEDALSDELFKDLRAYSRKTKLMNTSTTKWHVSLVGWSTPIMCWPLKGKLLERCRKELKKHVNTEMRKSEWVATLHVGGIMSYIPWHTDAHHKVNITIYLNDDWNPDYHGYFLYDDGGAARGEWKAITPRRNLALIYETPLLHSVALSSVRAPLRESLQIFINEAK